VNLPVLSLHMLNFALIGVLPRIFFRKGGRLTAKWWLTAAPFFLCPVTLIVAAVTGAESLRPHAWATAAEVVSVALGAGSIGLVSFTLGTHRVPISLWHQENDSPQHLVTHGAYRRIRHPFYTSFLLAFLGAFVFHPTWVTLVFLGYAVVALNLTAAREERRLAGSRFGTEYAEYAARTRRFIPPLRMR
jgi:protein-S-isoprenylcysteine O-methyltransferase Ste14